MSFFGKTSWTSLIVSIAIALVCMNVPVDAKSSQAAKKKEKTSVQKKSKPSKKQKKKKSVSKQKKAESDSSTVRIEADDPKAFTKALLLEKKGVKFEVIGQSNSDTPKIKPKRRDDNNYLDFSTMLVPITHEAPVGSKYGIRDHRLHRGIDVNVVKGEPIIAALPGKVVMSKYNSGGYGHYVLLEHENGIQTLYGHLSERLVKIGETVFPGDVVGLAGNTGKSSAAHLHFEIRYGEINIDPETIIDFPKWELKKNINRVSKKKITTAHYNLQRKLQKDNFYVVKSGDSQGDVANWFNISIPALCRINNLKPGAPLKAGQKLYGSK